MVSFINYEIKEIGGKAKWVVMQISQYPIPCRDVGAEGNDEEKQDEERDTHGQHSNTQPPKLAHHYEYSCSESHGHHAKRNPGTDTIKALWMNFISPN